jgi:hypothetical protein
MFDATCILNSFASRQVRFYHDLVLVPFHSDHNQMLVAAVLLVAAVAQKAEEALVAEGAAFGAAHMVVGQEAVDAALGAAHTLEEEANLVEGGAVVAPVPNRQQKLTVHPSHLGPREVPAASGAGEVDSKSVAQVVLQQPVPTV